jgi:antitoxin HicB
MTTDPNKKDLNYYYTLPYRVILETWDDGDGPYYVARIAELPHCMINGDTPEEAIREIEKVKKDWLKSNYERGLKIPEPDPPTYSGQLRLRIPPFLHRGLAERAESEGTSLNQFMTAALAGAIGWEQEKPRAQVRESKKKSSYRTTT